MLQKKNIFLMYALNFLQGLVFYAAVATLYRQQAGISLTEMALIESISFALSLLLEVPWGMLADRIGYRRTMIICSLLFALSKVIFWQAEGAPMFLLERVLLAVVCAGNSGVDAAILVSSCPENQQQRVFGLYDALGNAGLLAASAGFTLFFTADYRAAALATVVSYGIAALLPFFLTEVKPSQRKSTPAFGPLVEALRRLLHCKGLLWLVLAGRLFAEVSHFALAFLSQLQYQLGSMSSTAIGAVYTLMTALSLLSPLSAPLTECLGQRRTGWLLMVSTPLCCALMALTASPAVSIPAFLLMEAAAALYGPLHAAMENARIPSQDRATTLSVHALAGNTVAICVQIGLGAAADASLSMALGLCAAACLFAAAGFALVFRR